MTLRRAAWALPVVLFLATFGVFSVRHPGSVKAMLSSGQGIATTAAAIVAAAGLLFVATKRPAVARVAPFVLAVGVLGAAIYAEVPFERKSTQNRRLVSGAVVDATTTVPTPTTITSPVSGPVTSTVPAATSARSSPPAATRHSTGTLKGIDHSASGNVSIIESASGEWVVRFENFAVQGSPEPVLYVIEGDDRQKPGGTKLGAFTATDGDTLDVALPAGVRPGPGWTVLIWCEKFVTPIANATQR